MFLRRLSSIFFILLCLASTAYALDLRPTVSPWLEDGTNIFLRLQRNVSIGTALPLDALSIATAPVASATRALVNLSNTALSGGSANGTYLGANPAACTGDFLNFQLAGAARAKLTCAGALTVVSSTNNLSIFAATTSAQLAGVLTNKTGTGVFVLDTAPDFTTNIEVIGASGGGTPIIIHSGTNVTWHIGTGVGSLPNADDFQLYNNTNGIGIMSWRTGIAGTGSQVRIAQATAPTCTASCGTSPSVSGSDNSMIVTLGTGAPANPITITFNGTWSTAPPCVAVNRTTTANYVVLVPTTTTTAQVYFAAGPSASDIISLICVGI